MLQTKVDFNKNAVNANAALKHFLADIIIKII